MKNRHLSQKYHVYFSWPPLLGSSGCTVSPCEPSEDCFLDYNSLVGLVDTKPVGFQS